MYIHAIYTYVEKGKQTKDIYFVLLMIYLLFIIYYIWISNFACIQKHLIKKLF